MLTHQKHLFSLDTDSHYFNCAYKAPLLKHSEAAAIQALIKDRNPNKRTVGDFFSEIESVKVEFGKIVNCIPSQVAIIPSTSYGFSNVFNNNSGISVKQKSVLETVF